ncbi:MAG: ComEC/Rec2 family competence protein [Firmicutes bacterium]|nr:ComEC/Rec2 family competence protein [Bacillota bacterium]
MTGRRLALFVAVAAVSLCLYDADSPRTSFIILTVAAVFFARAAAAIFLARTKRLFYGDALLISAGITAALLLSFVSYMYFERSVPLYEGSEISAEGCVSEFNNSGSRTSFFLSADSINGENAHVKIYVTSYSGDLDIITLGDGDRVRISGTAKGENDPLFGYSDKAYLNSYGAFLSCTPKQIEVVERVNSPAKLISNLRNRISSLLSKLKYDQIATAVILGDKSGVDKDLKDDLRKCGASHTLAVSGLHLSVLVLFLHALLRKLSVPYRANALLTCAFTLLYMALAGFSYGIMRSGLMLILFLGANLFRRESDSVTNLFAAAGLILVFNRYAIYSISFQLTFLATLGIISVGAPYSAYIKNLRFLRRLNQRSRPCSLLYRALTLVATTLSVTLSAILFTLPVTTLIYGEVSLIAPVANMFILLVFEPALIASALYLVLSLVFFGFSSGIIGSVLSVLGQLCDGLFGIYSAVIHFFASFEHAVAFVCYPFLPYFVAACVSAAVVFALVKLKKKYYILVLICIYLAFIGVRTVYTAFDDSVRLGVIDVYCDKKLVVKSKAGAVLFEPKTVNYKNEKAALEDCLFRLGVEKLDCYVISSYSEGLPDQLEIMSSLVKIDKLLLPEPSNEKQAALLDCLRSICSDTETFSYGDRLSVCSLGITVQSADEKTSGFLIETKDKTVALFNSTSAQKKSVAQLWENADFVIGFGKNVIPEDLPFGSPQVCAVEQKYYSDGEDMLISDSCGEAVDLSEIKTLLLTLRDSGYSLRVR